MSDYISKVHDVIENPPKNKAKTFKATQLRTFNKFLVDTGKKQFLGGANTTQLVLSNDFEEIDMEALLCFRFDFIQEKALTGNCCDFFYQLAHWKKQNAEGLVEMTVAELRDMFYAYKYPKFASEADRLLMTTNETWVRRRKTLSWRHFLAFAVCNVYKINGEEVTIKKLVDQSRMAGFKMATNGELVFTGQQKRPLYEQPMANLNALDVTEEGTAEEGGAEDDWAIFDESGQREMATVQGAALVFDITEVVEEQGVKRAKGDELTEGGGEELGFTEEDIDYYATFAI